MFLYGMGEEDGSTPLNLFDHIRNYDKTRDNIKRALRDSSADDVFDAIVHVVRWCIERQCKEMKTIAETNGLTECTLDTHDLFRECYDVDIFMSELVGLMAAHLITQHPSSDWMARVCESDYSVRVKISIIMTMIHCFSEEALADMQENKKNDLCHCAILGYMGGRRGYIERILHTCNTDFVVHALKNIKCVEDKEQASELTQVAECTEMIQAEGDPCDLPTDLPSFDVSVDEFKDIQEIAKTCRLTPGFAERPEAVREAFEEFISSAN